MKILHISTGCPLSYQGGITNYVRGLVNIQYNNGYEVAVLGETDKNQYNFKYFDYNSDKIRLNNFGKMIDKNSLEYINKILLKEKFDIIHIHMVLNVDWDLFKILSKYNYIVSLHDYFYLCPRIKMLINNSICNKYDEKECMICISKIDTYQPLKRLRDKINGKFDLKYEYPNIKQNITKLRYNKYKSLLENASILLPVSKRVEEIYKESGIENTYHVAYIGNNTADDYIKYKEDDPEIKENLNIVFIGTLTKEKGAEILIKLLENIENKNLNFHFYGGADKNYLPKCEKMGLINHGMYLQNDLKNILSEADLGMVLSIWEDNGPQVVMELLNNNVPVFATKLGGIPDFVNEKNGFLFNPYDKSEFLKAVKFLNELNYNKIVKLKHGIIRTKNFQEHFEELDVIYTNTIKKNNKRV